MIRILLYYTMITVVVKCIFYIRRLVDANETTFQFSARTGY